MTENEKLGFLVFFVAVIFALVWMAIMLHEDLKEISRKQAETIKFLKKKGTINEVMEWTEKR